MLKFFEKIWEKNSTASLEVDPAGSHTKFKKSPITKSEIKRGYEKAQSLIDRGRLPWKGFDTKNKFVILEDGVSVGAIYELFDISCEGRSAEYLMEIQKKIRSIFYSMKYFREAPWVIQFYVSDDPNVMHLPRKTQKALPKEIRDSKISHYFFAQLEKHLQKISSPEGAFFDSRVSGSMFRGRTRRIRMVIYRKVPAGTKSVGVRTPTDELKALCKILEEQMANAQLKMIRYRGQDFYLWMLKWFNPNPSRYSLEKLQELFPYPDESDIPYGWDFAEQVFKSMPESDAKNGVWLFDNKPHYYMHADKLSRAPKIGQLTAELEWGDLRYGLLDRLPSGCTFVMTVVLRNVDEALININNIDKNAVGTDANTEITKEECTFARIQIAEGNYTLPVATGVYISGNDMPDLHNKMIEMQAILEEAGLHVVEKDYDVFPLDAYFRNLPMAYDYEYDREEESRSSYVYLDQIARLIPLYGRYHGTGHLLYSFFNRLGEVIGFNPYDERDKEYNSHIVMFGTTGSGKSATLTQMVLSEFAILMPRTFIIEAGNSFGLLAELAKKLGLKVNHIHLEKNIDIALNPFADSALLLEEVANLDEDEFNKKQSEIEKDLINLSETQDQIFSEDANVKRDYMKEMLYSALLMITGGEEGEARVTRQDRKIVLDAIFRAALKAKKEGRSQMIAGDLVHELHAIAVDVEKDAKSSEQAFDMKRVSRIREMAESIDYFCKDPTSAHFFNRPTKPWEDADLTVLDLGMFKSEGYEAQMGLAVQAVLSRALAIAESNQYSGRMNLVKIDELHVTLKNPFAAAYVTEASKMSRKLGLWMHLITQNVDDFAGACRKILSMCEHWIVIGEPSLVEIEKISEFKNLSKEEIELLQSIKKEPQKYTEGVVLNKNYRGIFRIIPPRIALALAMTEKPEKRARADLMRKHKISELEAAEMIGAMMHEAMGQSRSKTDNYENLPE